MRQDMEEEIKEQLKANQEKLAQTEDAGQMWKTKVQTCQLKNKVNKNLMVMYYSVYKSC